MILIPKYRDLIVDVKSKSLIRGWYKMEAVNADGRRRVLAEFPNLITTLGANAYATVGGYISCCLVGSGSTAPTVGDTALQTFVAGTNTLGPAGNTNSQSGSSGPTYWGSVVVQYAFATGAAAGNLSEVGVGSTVTNGNLFSRALILDGLGAPTTITVLASEALYVTYTLQQYAPTVDVTGNVTIAGTVYAYTLRAANAGAASWYPGFGFQPNSGAIGSIANAGNGVLGALTALPTNTSSGASGVVNNAYSSGSFQLTHAITWDITHGNLAGGISTMFFQPGTHGEYQIGFSPSIPKDASHTLTLNVGHSWAINTP